VFGSHGETSKQAGFDVDDCQEGHREHFENPACLVVVNKEMTTQALSKEI